MKYVMGHIPKEGVSAKGSYWDDAFTKSTPAAVVKVISVITELGNKTNLKPSLDKCILHAPNEKVAEMCRKASCSC